MEFETIVQRVIEWAKDRGIFDEATRLDQADKTQEELDEMIAAIEEDDADEIQDAIGDQVVTLIIQAEMNGLDFVECVESAYTTISKRTGKMINGKFVKDE